MAEGLTDTMLDLLERGLVDPISELFGYAFPRPFAEPFGPRETAAGGRQLAIRQMQSNQGLPMPTAGSGRTDVQMQQPMTDAGVPAPAGFFERTAEPTFLPPEQRAALEQARIQQAQAQQALEAARQERERQSLLMAIKAKLGELGGAAVDALAAPPETDIQQRVKQREQQMRRVPMEPYVPPQRDTIAVRPQPQTRTVSPHPTQPRVTISPQPQTRTVSPHPTQPRVIISPQPRPQGPAPMRYQ